ncbi:MAG TPA: redox-regulated ATPase YchF [Clostridiales bacterium]|nr:redox-regulated ATPase YchF [Clostridiales bacterium]
MKLGIVGLPNVGKSTLFNALTKAGAAVANYPFCTIEPNVGMVAVPDDRLYKLGELFHSKKIIHATIEFFDIAGLVKGASKGEGLGNKFLSHIREVDAIVHVVRCFKNDNITHVSGEIDPIQDIETINMELCLADLETLTKRMEKTKTAMKSGEKRYAFEYEVMEKVYKALEQLKGARSVKLSNEEQEVIDSCFLLTSKKVLYVANIADGDDPNNEYVQKVKEYAAKEGDEVVVLCAQNEADLQSLTEEERQMFLEELGLDNSGLDELISKSYKLLGLMSYLTAGEKETRAWTIPIGTKAPQAAGKIHTDFEKGFIRAEVINWKDLLELGSWSNAKEKGKIRSEGKDYVFQEGDVVLFRFNV